MYAEGFDKGLSSFVALDGIPDEMAVPVYLHSQFQGWTVEVDDVWSNAVLSAEFVADNIFST